MNEGNGFAIEGGGISEMFGSATEWVRTNKIVFAIIVALIIVIIVLICKLHSANKKEKESLTRLHTMQEGIERLSASALAPGRGFCSTGSYDPNIDAKIRQKGGIWATMGSSAFDANGKGVSVSLDEAESLENHQDRALIMALNGR